MKHREKMAHILMFLASKLHPCHPGYCFVKMLFGGWFIIDGCLTRQSACPDFKNGITWESWTLPDEFQLDLLYEMFKNGEK